jgi:hydrogenase maturation protease
MLSIIGCGNPNRKDDGVGIVIINLLQEHQNKKQYSNINLFDAGTSGMDVMFKAKGSDSLIIVDANLSNSKPGELFIVPGEELANIPEPSYNLHDFRWDNAIYAGKKIYADAFPDDISVYLIEATSVDLGLGLSSAVEETAKVVVSKIIAKMDEYGE